MDYGCLRSSYPGYPNTPYKYFPTSDYVPIFAYPEALKLIAEAVSSEKEDELFYDYLLGIAPDSQKDIVISIRDDEKKHAKMFREIYWEATGQDLPPSQDTTFERPENYCAGIKNALFGELGAVEKYRKILFGFEFLPYRNMITEIYTDELKHASKWNYLYTLNCK